MTFTKPYALFFCLVLVLVVSNFTQRLGWGTAGVFADVAASLLLSFIGSIAVKKIREFLADLAEQAVPFMEPPPAQVPIDRIALLLLVSMVICNMLASPFIVPRGWAVCVVFNIILACLSPSILIFRRMRPDQRQERLVLLYINLSRATAVLGPLPLIFFLEGAPVLVVNLLVLLILPALVAWNALFFWFRIRAPWHFRCLKVVFASWHTARRGQETEPPLILATKEDEGNQPANSEAQPKQEYDPPQISYPDMPVP